MNWYKKLISQSLRDELDGVEAPMDTPGKMWVYSLERAMNMATSADGSFRLEQTYQDRFGREICKFRSQTKMMYSISVAFNPQTFQVDVNMWAGKELLGNERMTSGPEQIPQTAYQVSQFVSTTVQKYHADSKFNRTKYQ